MKINLMKLIYFFLMVNYMFFSMKVTCLVIWIEWNILIQCLCDMNILEAKKFQRKILT